MFRRKPDYDANYKKLIEMGKQNHHAKFMAEQAAPYYEKLNQLLGILESDKNPKEKRKAIRDFEAQHQQTVKEFDDQVLTEIAKNTNTIITRKKTSGQSGATLQYLDYLSRNYTEPSNANVLFNLAGMRQAILQKYNNPIYGEKRIDENKLENILYPRTRYPTDQDVATAKRETTTAIQAAQALIADYKAKGKPLIISTLPTKEYDILNKGVLASYDLAVGLNNYVVDTLKQKGDTGLREQKIALEEWKSVLEMRNIKQAQINHYQAAISQFSLKSDSTDALRRASITMQSAQEAGTREISTYEAFNTAMADVSGELNKANKELTSLSARKPLGRFLNRVRGKNKKRVRTLESSKKREQINVNPYATSAKPQRANVGEIEKNIRSVLYQAKVAPTLDEKISIFESTLINPGITDFLTKKENAPLRMQLQSDYVNALKQKKEQTLSSAAIPVPPRPNIKPKPLISVSPVPIIASKTVIPIPPRPKLDPRRTTTSNIMQQVRQQTNTAQPRMIRTSTKGLAPVTKEEIDKILQNAANTPDSREKLRILDAALASKEVRSFLAQSPALQGAFVSAHLKAIELQKNARALKDNTDATLDETRGPPFKK